MRKLWIKPSHQHTIYTDNDPTMDHSSMDPSTMDMDMMMVPWFHFTGGDHLFFESWRPTSSGAIVGACIGLVFLALFDRWFAATRTVMESHWRHRGLSLSLRPSQLYYGKMTSTPSTRASEKSLDLKPDVKEETQSLPSLPDRQANHIRTIPPFIPSHDVPRGIMHGIQTLLGYLLMLAVMTFNAAYIISIVVGLGLGEVIFGRMGNGRGAAH
ncbi:Ctr copper transporter family-domain-containing protein [Collybia nuda]|uniref:Copper transport protein n=1 Tax=Collybia nuda TaxID=64659 RepID=A0A9P5XRD4_9AGAR|nr:Ctr copper transporter family-domain-containing protein [Collybia nuda]